MKKEMYQTIGDERKLVYKDESTKITFRQEFLARSARLQDDDGKIYVEDPLIVFTILSKSGKEMGKLFVDVDQKNFSAEVRTILLRSFFRDSYAKRRILNAFLSMKSEYLICDSVNGYADMEVIS